MGMDDPISSNLAHPELPKIAEEEKVQGETGFKDLGVSGHRPKYRGVFSKLGHRRLLYHDTGPVKESSSRMEPLARGERI
jgi:hypothetical protein